VQCGKQWRQETKACGVGVLNKEKNILYIAEVEVESLFLVDIHPELGSTGCVVAGNHLIPSLNIFINHV